MNDDSFKEKSYWMTTREYTPGPSLQNDIDVDVAIIGGGFTGLSSAYHIKKAALLPTWSLKKNLISPICSSLIGGLSHGRLNPCETWPLKRSEAT